MALLKLFAKVWLLVALAPVRADTFVIVHGAFQNAQSWAEVSKALKAQVRTVVAVDLPDRNAEGAAAKAVTIAQYVDVVGAVVKSQSEPVTLVGHSFGGMTISLVGLAMPEKIKKLLYVAAYIPESAESMQSLASGDKDNGFTSKSFVVSPDYAFATILEEDRYRLFINDGQPAQQKSVALLMVREPLGPIATKVEIALEKFAAIPKAYTRTSMDKTVSPTIQKMLIQRARIAHVVDIDTGHSPQVTQPAKLSSLVASMAK